MKRRIINPWTWQDALGYVQANEVSGHQRVLICAGQTSVDENGTVVHPNDMRAQLEQALNNVDTVLGQADMSLADVMRLNVYTTSIDEFFAHYEYVATRLGQANCRFAGTLLQIQRLADPELMVELEATAVV